MILIPQIPGASITYDTDQDGRKWITEASLELAGVTLCWAQTIGSWTDEEAGS